MICRGGDGGGRGVVADAKVASIGCNAGEYGGHGIPCREIREESDLGVEGGEVRWRAVYSWGTDKVRVSRPHRRGIDSGGIIREEEMYRLEDEGST